MGSVLNDATDRNKDLKEVNTNVVKKSAMVDAYEMHHLLTTQDVFTLEEALNLMIARPNEILHMKQEEKE